MSATKALTVRDIRALRGVANQQRATWGELEIWTRGVAGRQRLVRAGLVEQNPDFSACVILTDAGVALVERLESTLGGDL